MRRNILTVFLIFVLGTTAHAQEPLDIVVYGATGKVGRHIVQEALDRGHRVTAVSRRPESVAAKHENLTVVKGDLLDAESVSEIIAGKDVVIDSVRGVIGDSGEPESALQYLAVEKLVDALYPLGESGPYLIHVGGAGALEVEPGKLYAATLPTIALPKGLEIEILGQILTLEFLGKVDDVRWTYATPPKNFTNGKRTGVFRVGGKQALEDHRGRTRLSRADFAVAVIDEAEGQQHLRQQFSVAY